MPSVAHQDTLEHQGCSWTMASFWSSFGVSLIGISLLSSFFSFWSLGNTTGVQGHYILAVGLIISVPALILAMRSGTNPVADVRGFAVGLLTLLLSDWICRPYNLLQGPYIRGEMLVLGFLTLLALHWKIYRPILIVILPLASLYFFMCFSLASSGALIFSDDHATFLYRMMLLKENFPFIPFYNPLWNAGIDARDFFATGALNFYLLVSPVLQLFYIPDIYNLVINGLLFLIAPLFTFIAGRILGLSKLASAISAALSMSSSLLWYRWSLQYGTLGFVTTTTLIPLNLALAIKLLTSPKDFGWGLTALTTISVSLMLCWTPSGIIFLPLIIWGLLQSFKLLRCPKVVLLILALIAINLPWISLFWSVSKVSRFLSTSSSLKIVTGTESNAEKVDARDDSSALKSSPKSVAHEKSGELNLRASLKILREAAGSTNPLLFLLCLPGIFLFPRSTRLLFLSVMLWLFVLGTVIVPLKPQLELDRMLVVLAFISALPAGLAVSTLLSSTTTNGLSQKLLASFIGGVLLAGLLSTAHVTRNRSLVQFHFSSGTVNELANFIQKRNRGGRILFSGFVLHELDGGHLAPLTLFSKTPLIASSYVHNLWEYKQVFPEDFLSRGNEGIEEYLDLFNVTGVFAHEKRWLDHFNAHFNYQFIRKIGRFSFFERGVTKPSYFLQGDGKVLKQTNNSVHLSLKSSSAVVKFNYFPFISSKQCELSPYRINEQINFIRIENCTSKDSVEIRSISPIARLTSSFQVNES